MNTLGAWCAVRVGRLARIAGASRHPFNLAVFAHDAATPRETIDGVVILTQRGEVFGVRLAAVSPFLDVVYLAIISPTQATAPGTGWLFPTCHDSLLLRGNALGAVKFHGAFDTVDEHDESFFGELALDKFFARNLGAIG